MCFLAECVCVRHCRWLCLQVLVHEIIFVGCCGEKFVRERVRVSWDGKEGGRADDRVGFSDSLECEAAFTALTEQPEWWIFKDVPERARGEGGCQRTCVSASVCVCIAKRLRACLMCMWKVNCVCWCPMYVYAEMYSCPSLLHLFVVFQDFLCTHVLKCQYILPEHSLLHMHTMLNL